MWSLINETCGGLRESATCIPTPARSDWHPAAAHFTGVFPVATRRASPGQTLHAELRWEGRVRPAIHLSLNPILWSIAAGALSGAHKTVVVDPRPVAGIRLTQAGAHRVKQRAGGSMAFWRAKALVESFIQLLARERIRRRRRLPGNAVTTSRTRRSKMSGGVFLRNRAVNATRGDSHRHRRGVMIGISSDPRRVRLACGVPVLACGGDEGCRTLVDRLDAGQQNAGIRTARGQLG